MKIKILGMGCAKCKQLEVNTRKALQDTGIKAEIEKVTDIDKIIEFGVMSTPALAIDGNVKSSGKIATVEEIKKMLQ
ncbi:MAG: thioredoxin family protein [Candidatus Diapherotrites archaeon]